MSGPYSVGAQRRLCLSAAPASSGLADWLSGVFTRNMASLSVGELQEMEGEQMCEDAAVSCSH